MSRCNVCGREQLPGTGCLHCAPPPRAPLRPIPLTREAAPSPGRPCPTCAAPLGPAAHYCGSCGTPVRTAPIHFATLVNILPDGSEGGHHRLDRQEVVAGTSTGGLRFPDDPFLSPRHCRFSFMGGRLLLEDLGSLNGIFRKVRGDMDLTFGDELRIGRQLLRLEPCKRPQLGDSPGPLSWGSPHPGHGALLQQLLLGGSIGDVFPLRPGENRIGRDEGEITFPGDRFVSGRHALLSVEEPSIRIRDLGSSNGTFIRIRGAVALQDGDFLLLGNQILRVDLGTPGRPMALAGR